MAKLHQRVFALVAALLFLGTSVAVSGVVIWQITQQNKAEKAQKALMGNDAKAPSSIKQPVQPKEGQLQGTKLANFTPVSTVDALQTIDIKEGTGEPVKPGDTVTAHYTGAVAKDGTIFESSKDSGQPATFPLAQVIKGWQDGVPGMKVGGTRRLVIPAASAYGAQGSPPKIGPNEPLVFDIELVKIGQ